MKDLAEAVRNYIEAFESHAPKVHQYELLRIMKELAKPAKEKPCRKTCT